MNTDTFKGKWKEFKGELRNTWGNLTDDELEQTKGNLTSIGGLIQQKYGHAKDEISRKLNELKDKFSASASDAAERSESYAAKKTSEVKNSMKETRP